MAQRRRAIRIKNDGSASQFSVYDAATGKQFMNVYRIELLFDRGHQQARVIFGETLTPPNATRTEVFELLEADCLFDGVVCEQVIGPGYHTLAPPTLKFVADESTRPLTATTVTISDEWRDLGRA